MPQKKSSCISNVIVYAVIFCFSLQSYSSILYRLKYGTRPERYFRLKYERCFVTNLCKHFDDIYLNRFLWSYFFLNLKIITSFTYEIIEMQPSQRDKQNTMKHCKSNSGSILWINKNSYSWDKSRNSCTCR